MIRTLRAAAAAAALALATVAAAAPCGVGTLATYVASGSCEIGGTTFAGFELLTPLPAGSSEIPASAITVTPLVSATNPGLQFAFTAAAQASVVLATLFRFQVLAGAGTALSQLDHTLDGASATGDGVSLFIADLCLDGSFAAPPSGCAATASGSVVFVTEANDFSSGVLPLGALALLDVVANFIVDGGLEGTATASGGTLRFALDAGSTQVPEPGVLALAALALVALAARRRTPR